MACVMLLNYNLHVLTYLRTTEELEHEHHVPPLFSEKAGTIKCNRGFIALILNKLKTLLHEIEEIR